MEKMLQASGDCSVLPCEKVVPCSYNMLQNNVGMQSEFTFVFINVMFLASAAWLELN
jgi:hypothetical protein